ncbi:SAM-dependent MTase TRM10-type domain-containing protein, partial [Haematococcus lacustris]
MGAPGWPVLRHECPVAQAFPGKQLVIMSPDAEVALLPKGGEPLNPQAVYVVGGIVDRTVRKGLTLEYAAAAGLTAVRLPVLEYAAELGLGKGTTKRPVLNVNDVVVALLEYHRTGKDSFTNRALDETSASLKTLGVALDTRLVWGKGAIALTTGVTVILALAMLALGVGRSLIAYQADRTGASRMGGRLMTWMWLCAVFILLWWSLTMWFMILLLGELLWSAGALVVTSAARVGADTARHVPASMAVEINSTKGGSLCSTRCVDLSVFDFALGNTTCLCDLNAIVKADTAMSLAMHQMIGSITGAIMMLVAGGWVLMTSAAEFGVTRRERQLLRRIAKARAASASGEGAKLLNGVEGSSGALGGKNKKGGKKGGGGPEVIVDQETGEILDVEMSSISLGSRTRDGADNAPSAGGGGGSSKGVVGSLLSASKSAGRTVGKGVYLGGKMLDNIGSLLKGGR